MKLYKLFPDFTKLSYSERVNFLRSYRAKRALELGKHMENKKGKGRILLSDEDKALMKVLGVTQKDLKALKESINGD